LDSRGAVPVKEDTIPKYDIFTERTQTGRVMIEAKDEAAAEAKFEKLTGTQIDEQIEITEYGEWEFESVEDAEE